MALSAPTLDNLTLNLTQEIQVRASLDATFDALLVQMGPSNETPDGTPLPMKIEARPGGRCSSASESRPRQPATLTDEKEHHHVDDRSLAAGA